MSSLFGASVQRVEDDRLVRGRGAYLDDLGHDALAAAFVRSPHAHARILDIDVGGALEVDGLVAIYTHEDLPGRLADPLPLLIPHPSLTHGRTPYPLAKDEVNHVGEAVAMVIARDRYLAEDAADRIDVSYEPLPPVVGLDAARAAEHLVHADVPGNRAGNAVQEHGDTAAAIAAAPHVLELDLEIERSASTPLEGRGVLASWDPQAQRMQIWTSTQTSTGVRAAVAAKLGLALADVDVITPDVGGGFGVKIVHPWPEEVLVPWAAQLLGQPVKFTEDRREHFIASAHERAQQHHVRAGFDDEGRILGLDVRFWHDNGAYIPYGLIVPIVTSTQLLGPYKPGAYRVEFDSLYTNTVIVTPYRGAGRPQGAFVMERTMDAIAAKLGLDRTAVRERNFIQPGEMPYDQGLIFQDGRPLIYDSGDYPALLAQLKDLIGWDKFADLQQEARSQGRRLGIGLACYVEGTGVGPYEGGHVVVETSGKVKVATGLTTQGQGHHTVLAQVVADELGVPFADVEVVTGDTRRFGYAVGTFASRTAVMSGSAVALAARQARAKALRVAAEALEVSADDLEIVDGVVQVKGDPASGIGLGTVAVLSNPLRYAFDDAAQAATQFAGGDMSKPPVAEGDEPGIEGRGYFSPVRSTFAAGMHAAIVETDPDTAEVTILRYCVVHDCGRLINPRIVEGQIHGGVAQGVGGALYERMAYDDTGQLVNASFMDFLMPYVSEVPARIEIGHMETPSPLNPLGIKGAGEARVIPGAAVLAAAVEDAENIPITSMPLSPSDLFELRRTRTEEARLVKITGTATLHAPPPRVWAALNDPAVLARTIPGWEQMEPAGPDSCRLTIAARVASIQGTYTGDVSLTDRQEPTSLQLTVNAAGAPGTLNAHVRVCLEPAADGTKVTYDADAVPDGMIAGVGRRLLASTAKKLADEFFTSVDGTLVSQAAPVPGPVSPQEAPSAGPPQGVRAGGAAGVASPTAAPARSASGVTRERPTEDRQPAGRTGARPPTASFLTGVLAGAAATLAGVSVARLLGRRSSRHR